MMARLRAGISTLGVLIKMGIAILAGCLADRVGVRGPMLAGSVGTLLATGGWLTRRAKA